MIKKPNLIFDAGGVLVFPDFNLLADIANRVEIDVSPPEIAEQHARLFRRLDEQIVQNHQLPKIQYFLEIFKQVTPSFDKAQAAFDLTKKTDIKKHIWTTTKPWVGRSLRKLQDQGYQMAVVSNSDGRVDQILQELDLRKYFELVIDSFVVGVEKPDARIFEIALKQLIWDPEVTIYIGDIFYIDIWGANQAGLGAIHLDRMGLYKDWEGIHIPSVKELPDLLINLDRNPLEWDLFPARNFKINQ